MLERPREWTARPGAFGSMPPVGILFGHTGRMRQIRLQIAQAIHARLPILILGETGTGKEVIATFIHSQAPWRNGPFVKAYCPALPGTPLERTLFGAGEGFLSDGRQPGRGRVKSEPAGTIFLDEIAELDSRLQAKVIHRMRGGHTFLLTGSENRAIEGHVICSSRQQIRNEIEKGDFREDLFRQINVVTLQLPPLRERVEDIPILVKHFLRIFADRFHQPIVPASEKWIRKLQECSWPGNIRELENAICNYVLLGSEAVSTANMGGRSLPNPSSVRQQWKIRNAMKGENMSSKFSRIWMRSLTLCAATALIIATAHAQTKENSSRLNEEGKTVRTASASSSEMSSADPVKAKSAYVIGPGDLLAINVWNEPEVTGKVPVRTDGKITVPLAGEIQAGGLTPENLQAIIAQKLDEFMKQPAVTVAVEEMHSRQFNVLGEVEHPGSFPLTRPTRVLDALAQAGGFRDFAKVKKIYVLRRTPSGTTVKIPFNYKQVTQGKTDQDSIELQAGDTVIVP